MLSAAKQANKKWKRERRRKDRQGALRREGDNAKIHHKKVDRALKNEFDRVRTEEISRIE